jgi:hypothetical protein
VSIARDLLAVVAETMRFFWNDPAKLITACYHHYLGDSARADILIDELREQTR